MGIGVAAFAALVLGVYIWAWQSTDTSTVARVLVWMEADIGDQHRFPSRPIPAGGRASGLPRGPRLSASAVDPALRGTDTRAFVVVHGDRVVYERYDEGASPRTLETSFSVAKAFVATLVGLAIHEGRIGGVDDPVTRYVPELANRDPRFKRITLRHLLTMSSGLRYEESSLPWPFGDDTYTYYGIDLRQIALHRTEVVGPPGAAGTTTTTTRWCLAWCSSARRACRFRATCRGSCGSRWEPSATPPGAWTRSARGSRSSRAASTRRPATTPASGCSSCMGAGGTGDRSSRARGFAQLLVRGR